MRTRLGLAVVLALALAACESRDFVFEDGPRLISEVTLPPVTAAPTRAVSPTPSPETTAEETEAPPIFTPTESDFVLVTPTLPPTKTPTITPTVTNTVVITPTLPPTLAIIPADPILVPTQVFQPPQQVVAAVPNITAASPSGDISAPLPGTPEVPRAACTSAQWFFTNPPLPDCPLQPALTTQGAYQNFEYGFMIWVQAQDAIYVLYDSGDLPRWEVFQDTFEEGMPEKDPALDQFAPPYADWQPRRGFGLLWRTVPGMLDRIGWAESAYENPYIVNVQTRSDGTIYISEPRGRVISLAPGGADWTLYR